MKQRRHKKCASRILGQNYRRFKLGHELPTVELMAVCRLLLERSDSTAIDADELEELRIVAAELRRRDFRLQLVN